MRMVFFLVNFGVAALLGGLSVFTIVNALRTPESSAFAVLGGLFVVLAFTWWAIAEWLGFLRDRVDQERQAGLCCLFLGAMLLFAAVSSGVNGPVQGVDPSLFWGITAGLGLAALWFVACGMLRKRWTDATLIAAASEGIESNESQSEAPPATTDRP
jgi:drug/metabolite transporter (DMT)-like permease